MVLEASLLNTLRYKVEIKIKWSNSRKGVTPFPTSRKDSLRVPSTTIGQLTIIIIIIIISLFWNFFTRVLADGFSLEFEWQLFSSLQTLLSILAHLNNTVVWTVSSGPFISKSSSPFTNPFGIVPSAPISSGITVTFMLHSFLVL